MQRLRLTFFFLISLCLSKSLSFSMSSASPSSPSNTPRKDESKQENTIESTCACGSLSLKVAGVTLDTPTVDCHCPKCRNYHVAAFTSYMKAPVESVTWYGDTKVTHRDTCQEVGTVDRVRCSHCSSKMASTLIPDDEAKEAPDTLINLGPIEDKSVPDKVWMDWQKKRQPWQLKSKAVWPDAKPLAYDFVNHAPPMRRVEGGCGCGASRYTIEFESPSELQHCYCRLCRQFSGSAYQTWIPVPNEYFQWTTPEPNLVRTTNHGARHMCGTCGGVMTIVYDEDAGTIWPAAGGLVDETLPKSEEDMSSYMSRICHICCVWKQNWYKLPKDGHERIDYAA